jgi:hypothetical protein
MAKEGCPLIEVPMADHLRSLVESFLHCDLWRSQIITRLQAEHPRLVVLGMSRVYGFAGKWQLGFRPYDQTWLAALTRLVQQLRAAGSQVLVLGPVPNPQSVVPICLSTHLDNATACVPERSAAVNRAGIDAEAATTEAAGGRYADLTDLFCTTSRCPVIVGNAMVYLDSNHITLEYSRVLGPVMGALSDRALAQH